MQYAKDFTDALQFMWGEGFLSPGGPEEVAEMVAGIDLSGKRVLDIGSGLGGVDILLATTHGAAAVVGIDVESQLVESARALIAAKGLTERVTFQLVEPGRAAVSPVRASTSSSRRMPWCISRTRPRSMPKCSAC